MNDPHPAAPDSPTGREQIEAERVSHAEKGWTEQLDDTYAHGELAQAALCYIDRNGYSRWPREWSRTFFKRKTFEDDIRRAGSLFIAEAERLERYLATCMSKSERAEHGQPFEVAITRANHRATLCGNLLDEVAALGITEDADKWQHAAGAIAETVAEIITQGHAPKLIL